MEWSCNDPFHGALLDPRPAPDTALREAAQAALTTLDFYVEVRGQPDGIFDFRSAIAALRAALEAER